ncbi:MAG: small multi-drug export protein [Planctomycetota bacterium]|nr:small multi-drug export protein [Planctomycetota bacterium]
MTPTETHPDYLNERVGFLWRCAYLLGPLALTALVAGGIYLFIDLRTMNEVLIAAGASLFGAGTTVVFGKAVVGNELVELTLSTWDLAFIVMYVNAVSAWWYAYNLPLLQKLPKIGPYMRQARENAVLTLKQRPWIRRWAVVGVGAFVITPLPGSGALGGGLMGRILGISKKATFLSVAIAGVVVSIAYAMLARQAEEALNQLEEFVPPWVRIAVAVLAALFMIWVFSKVIRWFASHPPEDAEKAEDEAKSTPQADVFS